VLWFSNDGRLNNVTIIGHNTVRNGLFTKRTQKTKDQKKIKEQKKTKEQKN